MWLILCLLLHLGHEGVPHIGIRCQIVLFMGISSINVCPKELESSNAAGICVLALFETMTVLQRVWKLLLAFTWSGWFLGCLRGVSA